MFGRAFFAAIAALLVVGSCSAIVSEHTYAANNPFYKGRDVPGGKGVPCCNERDCRALDGYRMLPGGEYEILMPEGYWFKPNKNIVLKDVTPDGKAHACWQDKPQMAFEARRRVVFCVWIPIMFM
jgi:hypothetical protein